MGKVARFGKPPRVPHPLRKRSMAEKAASPSVTAVALSASAVLRSIMMKYFKDDDGNCPTDETLNAVTVAMVQCRLSGTQLERAMQKGTLRCSI
jgi:hypothetical protein